MINQSGDIIVSAVIVLLFGLCTLYAVQKGSEKITDAARSAAATRLYYLKQAVGIVLFGLIPLALSSSLHTYLQLPVMSTPAWIAFLLLVVSAAAAGVYSASHFVPEAADMHCRQRLLPFFFFLRIPFIISYEFFFRGAFLLSLLAILPTGMSILISTAAYTLLHAGSGKREFAGAIPFGIALCLICIATSSIWLAVLLHLLLALSYETLAIKKLYFHHDKLLV